MTASLTGRVAVVTGGARGIGRETVRVLAAAGADVAVIDRLPATDAVADARALGRRAIDCVADVSDVGSVKAAFERVRAELDDAHILVSGAAITNHIAPVVRMTHERWEHELATNLSGAFACAQAVLPAMADAGWGRIVFVSSVAARGGLSLQAAYAASKAGLLALAKTIALEHARDGVTCNAVLPGLIETEAVAAMPLEIRDAAIGSTPARRLGRMEEVAHLIAFLASDEAGFVNGAEIPIDGGIGLSTLALGSRREAKGALVR